MTKQDLRDGDRLTLRNGSYAYYQDGRIFGYRSLYDLREDLSIYDYGRETHNDIVKVERIQATEQQLINFLEAETDESVDLNNNLTYQTIWERPKMVEVVDNGNERNDK